MKKELERLMKLAGTEKFDIELGKLHEKYNDDAAAKEEISKFIKQRLASCGKKIEMLEKEIKMQEQL